MEPFLAFVLQLGQKDLMIDLVWYWVGEDVAIFLMDNKA